MSQIIWKLSLTVSALPHDSLEFMVAMAQPPHLGDEGNLAGCSPACCGRKSLSLATVQGGEGFLSTPGAQDLRAGVSCEASRPPRGCCAGTQSRAEVVPSPQGPAPTPSQWLDSIFRRGRLKGSELENPRGRGIFSPMQITLSPLCWSC